MNAMCMSTRQGEKHPPAEPGASTAYAKAQTCFRKQRGSMAPWIKHGTFGLAYWLIWIF
jgi:hypothetical protein